MAKKKTSRFFGLPFQAGQVSKLLLVLAIIILVAVVIVYLVMRMAEKPPAPVANPGGATVLLPIYDQTLGNINFSFITAKDLGNTLRASDIQNNSYNSSYQQDITTSEKYIKVTIGAQNKGTENIDERSWDLDTIVDSQGREFVPLSGYNYDPWLPNPNLCGTLLKPAFDPTPCVKIYEVAKVSTGLKIRVVTGKDNSANNFSSNNRLSALIDLIVK